MFSRKKKHPEIVFTIDLRNEKINEQKENATRIRKGARKQVLFFFSTSYRNENYYYVKGKNEKLITNSTKLFICLLLVVIYWLSNSNIGIYGGGDFNPFIIKKQKIK